MSDDGVHIQPEAGDASPLGVTVRQIADMMERSLYWDSATLQEYQRLQLGQLLRHAKRNVPFYATRLDCMFRADGSIDWSRWHDVPLLKRSDLRDHGNALRLNIVPPLHGSLHTGSSSGSTGVPIATTFPRLFTHVANVAWNRFYDLHGVNFVQGFTDFRSKLPDEADPDREVLQTSKYEIAFLILRNLPIERKLHWLAQSPFKVLRDMPNHAELLARANLRLKNPIRLDYVIGIRMALTSDQRSLFLASFGAKSISPYSSKEGSLLAFECPQGSHFHSCAELNLLEVLEDNGCPSSPGAPGRCIITPFFNSAQPLIRYEQGDVLVRGTHCAGGLTLPVIQEISGRQDSIFRFPGRDIAIIGIDVTELREMMKADAFQLAQTGPENIEVRYVSPAPISKATARKMTSNLQKILGATAHNVFRHLDQIPANAGGKQQRFVREYEPTA